MYTIYKRTFPDGKVYIGCTSKSVNARMGMNGLGYASSPFFEMYSANDWLRVTTEIISRHTDIASARAAETTTIQEFLSNHSREQLLNTQLTSTYTWDDDLKEKFSRKLRTSETFQQSARSEEHRLHISESIKQKWEDPEYREAVTTALHESPKVKASYADPERRQKISASLQAYHTNPTNHAKFLEVQRSEERCTKLSESVRNSEKHKAGCANPENRKKLSESLKRYYADPEHLNAMRNRLLDSATFHEAIRAPERRAKISKAFTGRRWIHKGTERKLVRPEDVDAYLQDGWIAGMK